MKKPYILSTSLGFLAFFLATIVIDEMLFGEYLINNYYIPIGASPGNPVLACLAGLVMVIVLVYLAPRFIQENALVDTLKLSVLLGIFTYAPSGLVWSAILPVKLAPALFSAILGIIDFSMCGFAVGFIFARYHSPEGSH